MKCPICVAADAPIVDLGAGARPRVHFSPDGKTRTVTELCEGGCGGAITTTTRGSHQSDGAWKPA